jgi:signal transduction histidine kinase
LKTGVPQARQTAIAGRVLTSARRMARMIEDILDFTRLRIGSGIPLTMGEHDLATLTSTIVEELRLTEGAPAIEIESSGDTRGLCDPERVLQVLSNLLGNAVQHGTPGQPIRVRIDGVSAEEMSFHISNSGKIPPELLPCIFDPFRRSGIHTEGTRAGLGLGLYISQQIVAAHGGTLEVESENQTVFRVCLPRRRATVSAFKPVVQPSNVSEIGLQAAHGK